MNSFSNKIAIVADDGAGIGKEAAASAGVHAMPRNPASDLAGPNIRIDGVLPVDGGVTAERI